MNTLKMLNATVRVENSNDASRQYKVVSSISVNEENGITSVVSGQVYTLDGENKQVASFDSHRDGNLNYQFYGVSYEQQKLLIDVIGVFVDELRIATVSVII